MRDIFKSLILANCAAFFLWHTRTSFGELSASKNDLELTERVRKAGALLGIPLLDHLVVNRETHISIKKKMWYEEDEWMMIKTKGHEKDEKDGKNKRHGEKGMAGTPEKGCLWK